ncbi:MAG: Na/Pi cotransporter family protein, partial [Oscillospiraceae bacterium]|nr:Na/Pi cotransporter family protein [Oscillospiraceae bacterium]
QSASAAVGILQALAVTGAIDFSVALPIIMGIAIGAAVPVLLSALGANAAGKRTAWSYLVVDTLGVIVFSAIFYSVNAVMQLPVMSLTMTTVTIAALNTVFRIVVVLLLAPFIGLLEKLVCRLIKDDADAEELLDMDRLEERFLAHPAIAVEQSRLTVNAMAEKSRLNILEAFSLLEEYSDAGFNAVERMEDVIDRYEDKIGTYLVQLTGRSLEPLQNEAVSKFLHTINDFERMSDHALNVAESAKERKEKNIEFSEAGRRELRVLTSAVAEVVSIAVKAFTENDLELANRVEPLEEHIDNLCDEMKLHHIDRLSKGSCTITHGYIFNDLLTDLERISDHCSNIAVAMIELESATFDTHEYINSLNTLHTKAYDEYYAEYSEKYAL